jgi:hypothetical protein
MQRNDQQLDWLVESVPVEPVSGAWHGWSVERGHASAPTAALESAYHPETPPRGTARGMALPEHFSVEWNERSPNPARAPATEASAKAPSLQCHAPRAPATEVSAKAPSLQCHAPSPGRRAGEDGAGAGTARTADNSRRLGGSPASVALVRPIERRPTGHRATDSTGAFSSQASAEGRAISAPSSTGLPAARRRSSRASTRAGKPVARVKRGSVPRSRSSDLRSRVERDQVHPPKPVDGRGVNHRHAPKVNIL